MKRMFLIAAALFAVTPAHADLTPLPAQYFCQTHPDQCRGGGADTIVLTDAALRTLQTVNRRVNRAIRPQRDAADVWALAPAAGDCEDYALTKRAMLIEAGWPPNALRLAIGQRRGEAHAILIVQTDRGILALDNLRAAITTLADNGLIVTALSSGDLAKWSAK